MHIVGVAPQPRNPPTATTPRASAKEVELMFHADLSALQGERFSYADRTSQFDLNVHFVSGELRALADNVLRDNVLGASLILKSPTDVPPPPSDGSMPWYDQRSAMIRSVAAMPGVVNYHWAEHNGAAIVFRTTTQAVADHLKLLVNPYLGDSRVVFAPAS